MRVCVCSFFLAGLGGPASRARFSAPHLFLWPLCLCAFLCPLPAGVAPFVVHWLPSPPPFFFFFLLFCFPRVHLVSFFFWLSAPAALGLGAFFFFPAPPPASVFFFLSCAPIVSGFLCFPAPGALGLGFVCCLYCWPLAPRLSVRSRLLCGSCLALGFSLVVAVPSPPFCVSLFFSLPLRAPFFFSLRAPVVSGFLLFPAPGAVGLGAVCCLFCWPPSPQLPVRSRLFCGSRLAVGCFLVVVTPAPPLPLFCVSLFILLPLCAPFFFFFFPLVARPHFSWVSLVPGPRCPGPWRCVLFVLLASRSSALCGLSPPLWFPPGRSLLSCGCCPPPLPFCVSLFFSLPLGAPFFSLVARPRCLLVSLVSGPGALGLGAVCCLFWWPPAPQLSVRSPLFCGSRLDVGCFLVFAAPPLCLAVFVAAARCPVFFSLLVSGSRSLLPLPPLVRVWCLVLSGVAALRCPSVLRAVLWCLALLCCGLLRAVRCLLGCLLLRFATLSVAAACRAVSLVVPSGWVVRGVACCLVLVCFAVCRAVLCVPGCGAAPRCCASCLQVLCCCVLCCFVAFVWCCCLLCRVLWRCPSPWGPVLWGAVFCGVPPRCVLCAVCVLSWRAGASGCSPLCCVLCVSWGVALCVLCPLCSVRCCVPLCWCACVVLFVWCALLLTPGAVVRCCVLCCFLVCSVLRCLVWWPVVICWPCVSVSVSLSGRVVWFPVAGVVCCGALLPCVVFRGAVLSHGAVLLCSAVVLQCCLCLLCPPVACRAVLCSAVGCLCCFVPGGGVCVLWCPVPPCRHAQKH